MFEFSVQWKEGKTEEADQYFLSINHGLAIYLVTYNIMLFNPYRSPVGCAYCIHFTEKENQAKRGAPRSSC